VMAYLPPRNGDTSTASGQQALYTMTLDGSEPPRILLKPQTTGDQYFQPMWSPDGKYIYFAHVDYYAPTKVPGQHYAYYEIYRMAYPNGQPQKLAEEA
jgi:Tol biopolymer transport system component